MMATNFPTSLDSLTNPSSGDSLSSPSHAAQHSNVNDAVEALQAKVGVDGSAVTGSLDYKVANQGLTLVKSQTITGTPSSVTITDAFSSTFSNYRIMAVNLDYTTTADEVDMELGTGGVHTGLYYGVISRYPFLGAINSVQYNNAAPMAISYTNGSAGAGTICVDFFSPYAAAFTSWAGYAAGIRGMRVNGFYNSAGSFTSVTFECSVGTFVAGKFLVYGYNDG